MNITNEQIAVKVMGIHVGDGVNISGRVCYAHSYPGMCQETEIPDFLHDMNAAMMVLDKMEEKGYSLQTETWPEDYDCVPIAICFAALNAIEATERQTFWQRLFGRQH